MNTLRALAMGAATKDKELMVFDWEKAAQLIKEHKPSEVSAGLTGDWEWTGGFIFENGKPVPKEDTYVYLASTWSTPEISLDGQVQDCFKMQSETPNWHAHTYWPDEALALLKEID